MRKAQRVALLLAITGLVTMTFVVRITDQTVDRISGYIAVTGWLESVLWVSPGILLLGGFLLLLAVVIMVANVRAPSKLALYVVTLVGPVVIVLGALVLLVAEGAHANLG